MSLLSRSSVYFEMYPGLGYLGCKGGDSLFSVMCKETVTVVSNSPGLVDFAIGLVIVIVLN